MLATAPGSRLVIREKRGRRHLHRNIYPNSRSAFGGYIATGSGFYPYASTVAFDARST